MKRFWDKVRKTNYCWEWIAFKNWGGYGYFKFNNGNIYAHRYSWIIANGEIPPGLLVCHKCDNPACVRPSHLFIGTHQDNMDDKAKKGRCWRGGKPPRLLGEAHQNHKLTEKEVLEIRANYKGKYGEGIALARKYGVDRSAIYLVIKRKNWAHI
jgi:HNH endonuclease